MVLSRSSGSILADESGWRHTVFKYIVYKELIAQMNATGSEKQSAKIGSQRQPTLYSVVSKTQPHNRIGRWWTALTGSITYWIAKDGLPLFVVEKSGFEKMMYFFYLKYDVPSGKEAFQLFVLARVRNKLVITHCINACVRACKNSFMSLVLRLYWWKDS